MVFFQEMLQIVSLKKKTVFVQNGVSICSRSLSLSGRILILPMKQKKECKVLEWPAYSSDLNPIKLFVDNFDAAIAKTDSFLGKFRKSV